MAIAFPSFLMTQRLASGLVIGCFAFVMAFGSASAQEVSQRRATGSLQLTPEQRFCIRNAAFLRETRILNALNAYYTAMERTLQARRALLRAGWAQENGSNRRSNIQSIWKKFGFTWRDETEKMKKEIRLAWETYRTARSAECKIVGYDDESGGLAADSQF
jgi:hypothetical protein